MSFLTSTITMEARGGMFKEAGVYKVKVIDFEITIVQNGDNKGLEMVELTYMDINSGAEIKNRMVIKKEALFRLGQVTTAIGIKTNGLDITGQQYKDLVLGSKLKVKIKLKAPETSMDKNGVPRRDENGNVIMIQFPEIEAHIPNETKFTIEEFINLRNQHAKKENQTPQEPQTPQYDPNDMSDIDLNDLAF